MEGEREQTNNQNLPFGHYVDAQRVETNGLESGAVTPPQYARAISGIHRVTDTDDPETVDSDTEATPLTDVVVMFVVRIAGIFLMPIVIFTTFLNIVFLQSSANHENGLFFTKFNNSTNGANSGFVIEVNEEFVLAINRSLFFITMFALVMLIFWLATLYNKDLVFEDKAVSLEGPANCVYGILLALFLGSPFAGALLVFTGNIPDFVAAFNIPETWFIPGNEAAATSLGFALVSLIYVLESCICCLCCVYVATHQD